MKGVPVRPDMPAQESSHPPGKLEWDQKAISALA